MLLQLQVTVKLKTSKIQGLKCHLFIHFRSHVYNNIVLYTDSGGSCGFVLSLYYTYVHYRSATVYVKSISLW